MSPARDAYWPRGQYAQAVSVATRAMRPAGQTPQAVAPVADVSAPAAQAAHADWPVILANVPSAHSVHAAVGSPGPRPYCPAGHGVHTAGTGEYRPVSHTVQAVAPVCVA